MDKVNLGETLYWWHVGQYVWSTIYYVSGLLMIAMPAVIAANLMTDEYRKKLFACCTAILAGVVGWLQPGARATAHEHAFVCLREVSRMGTVVPSDDAFKACNNYIDYTYEPASNTGAPKPAGS